LDKSEPRRVMNEKQILEIVPVSRTTLYWMERDGKFPWPTYISPNRRVWLKTRSSHGKRGCEFNPNGGRVKGASRPYPRLNTAGGQCPLLGIASRQGL
jgi:prophage regulatory protein